jgi:hypothetical protein
MLLHLRLQMPIYSDTRTCVCKCLFTQTLVHVAVLLFMFTAVLHRQAHHYMWK